MKMKKKNTVLFGVPIFIVMFFGIIQVIMNRQREYINSRDVETSKYILTSKSIIDRADIRSKTFSTDTQLPFGRDIADVIAVAMKMNSKPLLVTLINKAYLEFALSWLCNTENMGIHKQVLIISTDNKTKETIKHFWPDVNVVSISGMHLDGDQSYSHAGYVRLTNFRAHVLLELLLHQREIFLFEVDALWVKNPVPVMSGIKGYDILGNPVSERPGLTAIGFLYLHPTTATILTWRELNRKLYQLDKKIKELPTGELISEGDNDQIYLSGIINKRLGGLKKKELPLGEYADGKWYNMPEDKRKISHPYVINNNWVIGNNKKTSRAKEWGHWFLKQDRSCNKEQVRKVIDQREFWHPLASS